MKETMKMIRMIVMIPFIIILYTVFVVLTYFVKGIEAGVTIWELLYIKNIMKLFIEWVKGFKTLNDGLDELW